RCFGTGGTRRPGAFRRARRAHRATPGGHPSVPRTGGRARGRSPPIVMTALVGGLAGGGDPVIIAIPIRGYGESRTASPPPVFNGRSRPRTFNHLVRLHPLRATGD